MKISENPWLHAFRVKTLPLALSNTIVGSALALFDGGFRWSVFMLAAITTFSLQILSNLANDYGDFINGKDTDERVGPKRMVHSGAITSKKMLYAMFFFGILSAVSGLLLIWEATGGREVLSILIFIGVGLAAIVAAIKYTVGKNPYGYRGLGDLFVFIFFGIVGVAGTYFMHTQKFEWDTLLPASTVGFLCVGVLNMNNMRDYVADKHLNKRTLVVLLGETKAKYYHLLLIVAAFLSSLVYMLINNRSVWQFLFLSLFPLFVIHLRKVFRYTKNVELSGQLPFLSFLSLLFSLLFTISIYIVVLYK